MHECSVPVDAGALRGAYASGVNATASSGTRHRLGFTLVELLVVIAILLLLLGLLVPALAGILGATRSRKDMSQARGIHQAMMLHASGDEGRFPLPSRIQDESNEDWTLNTTSNLFAAMLAHQYFGPDLLVSPVESNPAITVDLDYDHEVIDGQDIFWDPAFTSDFNTGAAHSSYAHQALCGQRVRLKWHSSAGHSDVVLSNRGVEDGDAANMADSNTLAFHGDSGRWIGIVIAGDGAAQQVESFIPEFVAYQPLNGEPLGPDNLFATDWLDMGTNAMACGDNWLTISPVAIDADAIEVIWD